MTKKITVLFVFLIALSALSFIEVHKFYVSVTNVEYSAKDDALQITTRIFIDDLESALKERYGVTMKLATQDEAKISNEYIEKYFKQKFAILMDGEVVDYQFLGKKYDNDVVLCYIEIPKAQLNLRKTLAVQNEILTDMFEEQKNIVHIKLKGKKKSFVLIRENNKGMLNL